MTAHSIRLNFGVKIFSIVISILLFIIVVAIASYLKIRDVRDEVVDLSTYIIPITDLVGMIDAHVLEQEVYLERLFTVYESEEGNREYREDQQSKFEARGRRVDEEIEKAVRLITIAEENALLEEDRQKFRELEPQLRRIEKEHREFHKHAVATLAEFAKGHFKKAHTLEEKIEYEEQQFNEEINSIYRMLETFAENAGHKATAHQNEILRLNIILTVAAVLLGILSAYFLTRNLIRPIRELITAVRKVGEGDYSVRVRITSRDEIRSLGDAFESMVEELALKERIKTTFGKYVDPRVVENLIDREAMKTGGEKKEMTVMFSQISHFEHAIEQLEADEQISATNQYLALLSKTISDQCGVLDKYIDTIVMAFWGPPFTSESEHLTLACRAALEQKRMIEQMARILEARKVNFDKSKLKLRCGICSGPLVVGNMGSEQAKSYTVLGDTVNIASRLKGACSQYDVPILVSSESQQAIDDGVVTREVDRIQVIGKEDPVVVYEPLYESEMPNPELEELGKHYDEGLKRYREQNWEKSRRHFAACLEIIPDDGPSRILEDRCRYFAKHPPAADWSGVWQLRKK